MKIEYLKEFVALAGCLNFSQAAEQLYITQPVLSRHISAMERELGVRLFTRTTQNVALTSAGELFLLGLEPMLEHYEGLLHKVRLKEEGYTAQLRIGLPYYSTNYYLGKAPLRFMQEHPEVKLTYRTAHPDQIIGALARGEVDLLIISHMPFRRAEEFVFQDLFDEAFSVLLPREHPLAERESVTVADLAEETFLGVDSNFFFCTWSLLREWAEEAGFAPKPPLLFNQLESVIIEVQQGRGILLEGENLRSLPQNDLAVVPLQGEECVRKVSVVFRRGKRPALLEEFARILKQEHAKELNEGKET